MVEINNLELKEVRKEIDRVDNQILSLIEARFELVKKVAEIKKKNDLPIRDLEREKEVIESKVQKTNLPESFIRNFYRSFIDAAIEIERREHKSNWKIKIN